MRIQFLLNLCAFLMLVSPMAFAVKPAEVLYVDSVDDYPVGDSGTKRSFLVSNSLNDAILEIRPGKEFVSNISCDEEIKLKKMVFLGKKKKGTQIDFKLKKPFRLTMPKNVNQCVLTFWEKSNPGKTGALKILKDEAQFPFLKNYNNRKEICNYSLSDGAPIQKEFLSGKWLMMSCAHPMNKMEILDDSEESFLSKMEMLLGYRPGIEFIKNQNPYAELDFTNTPKFDAIFLATLLYRRDFSGTVLARILKHHADKGTLINIIGTGYMHGSKDKALLKELAKHENIRVQEYKYHSPNAWPKLPGHYISNYLRDFHMKMLVTVSSDIEENNSLIIGGRNVHDGFVFSTKPDFSSFPELNQFAQDEAYAYWQDLEIKVNSSQLAQSVYSHMLKFWNRVIKNQEVQSIRSLSTSVPIDAKEVLESKTPMARHFLSIPFDDEHALEKLYIQLIDAARNNIKLSTPYLRPTKALLAAIERAANRGVDITIQTRIDLKGDTQAWLYEETNKAAINKLYDKVKLYEWTQDSILHTKLITIDNKVGFFGSVNVSRRSFVQDIEHGLLINGENAIAQFNNLFQKYNDNSRRIDEKQARKFWASIVIGILPNQF